jgi:hypothetical protein
MRLLDGQVNVINASWISVQQMSDLQSVSFRDYMSSSKESDPPSSIGLDN